MGSPATSGARRSRAAPASRRDPFRELILEHRPDSEWITDPHGENDFVALVDELLTQTYRFGRPASKVPVGAVWVAEFCDDDLVVDVHLLRDLVKQARGLGPTVIALAAPALVTREKRWLARHPRGSFRFAVVCDRQYLGMLELQPDGVSDRDALAAYRKGHLRAVVESRP